MADRELTRTTNRELVGRCAEAGPDDPVWPEFLSRFHARMRLVVYRSLKAEAARHRGVDLGSPGSIVDDLVQEAYVKLLAGERRALHGFHGKSDNSIYTYLASIAANVTRDHFKKLRAQKTPPAATSLETRSADPGGLGEGRRLEDSLASAELDPEEMAHVAELKRRAEGVIEAARGSASPRDLLVYRLHFVEGSSVEEIAACAGIGLSQSGVEKCVRRLRDTLKESLESKRLEGGWRRKYRL